MVMSLTIRRVGFEVGRNLGLPSVAVIEQFLLVIVKLFARFCRVFEIGAFDDGVDGTRFLAKTAINTLGHVDIVSRRSSAAISSLLGLNGDGLSWTDRLTELAGDASLLSARIPP